MDFQLPDEKEMQKMRDEFARIKRVGYLGTASAFSADADAAVHDATAQPMAEVEFATAQSTAENEPTTAPFMAEVEPASVASTIDGNANDGNANEGNANDIKSIDGNPKDGNPKDGKSDVKSEKEQAVVPPLPLVDASSVQGVDNLHRVGFWLLVWSYLSRR